MIARLDLVPNGCFCAEARTVGATDEEVVAVQRGELPEPRREAVAMALRFAANALAAREVMGHC